MSTHLSNIEGMEMAGKLPEVRLANTPFKVVSPFEPSGDQPEAIAALAKGVEEGLRYQTLLGVTGSGKTFTMAKTIEAVQKPTLVMAPNKTLAAQLAAELKEFFPDNAVVYFVSYYDYYQPEAYVPSSDTFIEKDASINEEVEKLRHAATSALLSRRDVIVVASVSCIYGIGSPMDYAGMAVFVDKQKEMDRDEVIHELIDIQYDRNDYEQKRGTFRVRGDALDVFPPYTVIDYFPKDFLCIIDESHVTVPQIRGMHEGDRSRKITLAEHGFRLPSCLDNRPLRFDEFEERIPQFIYVSATPGDYEERVSQAKVDQVIRPTGLLDPEIVVRTSASQIDDIIDEAKERAARNERVLITTLTKKMAEDLTDHLLDQGVKARYMHSDIATLERTEILRDLRRGEFDVLVGINLLREGLDLPEVSLVAILDADKEGFLRNHRSLIQTIGRAARNVSGQVIMYADRITDSMRRAIDETRRRRDIQMAYNEEHGIKPQTIRKAINDIMGFITEDVEGTTAEQVNKELAELSREEVLRLISSMEDDMAAASRDMDFEEAARLRDQVVKLKSTVEDKSEEDVLKDLKRGARKGSAYGNRKHAAYGSSRAN